MAYSDFTFPKLRKQYKILQDTRNLFPNHFNEAAVSERLIADIEEGHISTASCILGNIAMKTGRSLSYNPLTREVIGDAEATQLLQRSYRKAWVHPHPDKV